MSLTAFQASITINSLVEQTPGSGIWTMDLNVVDMEGVHSGYEVAVGDVIVLDTADLDVGTLTRYVITTVNSKSYSTVNVVVQYAADNGGTSVDLNQYEMTRKGLLTRKTPNNSLLNLPSLQIQGLSDKFAFYLINFMNRDIVDTLITTSTVTSIATTVAAAAVASSTVVRRKVSVTNNGHVATINIVASGSQASLDAITVTQTGGNTITLSNVPSTLFLQSITVRTPSGFNPTSSFQIQYPEPFGDTSALDMMAPFMMSYNEPGVIQATTLINYSISAGIVQAQKTGLVANAAQVWRLQVM